MPESLFALALLACPLGMGAMMWMMRRDNKEPASQSDAKQAEVAALRAQIDQLEAHTRSSQGVPPGTYERS